jgi:two-component system nitrogen regulation sensor histidine kinase NtrY
MTFRTRLLLAFLALSLVPTGVLAFFALDRLERSLQLWKTPGVDRAFEAALETSKTSLARMEATVLARANGWAETLAGPPLTPARRGALQADLRAAGLDFAQLYRRAGTGGANSGWRLVEEVRPPGVLGVATLDLSDELGAMLPANGLLHSRRGVLAGVAALGADRAVIAGMLLPPSYFDDLARVSEGLAFYRRFGVVRDVSRTYTWLLVAVLAGMLALAAVWTSAALARGMTRPLSRLEEAVERVAAGDLSARVDPRGAREVVALGERFNVMTERLGAAQEALKRAEREAAWREVARRLAHEFKNILTPMSLSLHRLGRRAAVVPEEERDVVRESLAALARGVDQLARLAEQFSQYARLPEPRFEPVDLDRLVREAIGLHEHEGITVRMAEGGVAPLWVRGDTLLLSRAIHNLILNACEASPPGGAVDVRILAAQGEATVEVLDRGSGIAPEVRGRLFEPYVSTRQRGSGLGLSLVREIAEQHHGTITVEDRDGGGTCARLTLPRTEPVPNQDGIP